MIFVTVGTHEQQFDRLIKYVDELNLPEEVMIQRGYSDYIPRNCRAEKLLPYEKMKQYTERARIVITHGGPSSIMMPLQMGKIPIVVPRQKKFGEHVNDHQVEFVQKISGTTDIIPVIPSVLPARSVRRRPTASADRPGGKRLPFPPSARPADRNV